MRLRAVLGECQRCRQPVIEALCTAIETQCDPIPMSRPGEIQAAISGRETYRLDNGHKLWRNDQWRIRTDAPEPGDFRLAAHVCYAPIPAAWAAPTPDPTATRTVTDESELMF